ncbi:hypothetical protein BGZ99_003396 [Dissophora globulifera]|uniref:Uncharacterized protein n=1 Tax=Dissophora globulifera TaxID=979702 RepID=A0A9P6RKF0_9FUNG|nr:hypothetical protein BGZ99_003396 [Dissophora globulifera]
MALQASRLVHLLQSIEYPYEISLDDIRAALSNYYSNPKTQHQHHSPAFSSFEVSSDSTLAVEHFLNWLIENVAAETNWPGYAPAQQRRSIHLVDGSADSRLPGEDAHEDELILQSLDQEHWQLQNTLASLEQELSDLRALETHATDVNRGLDADVHDVSVQFDATATKLLDTTETVLSQYLTASSDLQRRDQDSRADADADVGMDVSTFGRESSRSTSATAITSGALGVSAESRQFLYQYQEELREIQQLDAAYIAAAESLLKQIMDTITVAPVIITTNSTEKLSSRSKSSSTSSTSSWSMQSSSSLLSSLAHLDQLLKRNPTEDKELIWFCSTYRATKMSHIRVMAQLKCLEEELTYMKDLDAKHGGEHAENGTKSHVGTLADDLTGDYSMYTIASSRNEQIRNSRQQEIELISVQRETARLMEEMEQLLSDPITGPSKGNGAAADQNSSDDSNGYGNEVGDSGGVLFDICERIARNDIELQYLAAAHRDYLRAQEQAFKELDGTVVQLLEYYCLGMATEQTLAVEKEMIQQQKDILEAVVQECREFRQQSKWLHVLAQISDGRGREHSALVGSDTPSKIKSDQLLALIDQHQDLESQAQQEQEAMQISMQETIDAEDVLRNELLYKHSTTNQIQFVPKTILDAKDDLAKRARKLQHDYDTLSDQMQYLAQKKTNN